MLDADMTRFFETLVDELFANVVQIPKRPRHNVAQWWAERLAPGRPVLAKEVRALIQDVFRCP